jgi:hypothetical protein
MYVCFATDACMGGKGFHGACVNGPLARSMATDADHTLSVSLSGVDEVNLATPHGDDCFHMGMFLLSDCTASDLTVRDMQAELIHSVSELVANDLGALGMVYPVLLDDSAAGADDMDVALAPIANTKKIFTQHVQDHDSGM